MLWLNYKAALGSHGVNKLNIAKIVVSTPVVASSAKIRIEVISPPQRMKH